MSGKIAKMLRRLAQDTKAGKKTHKQFSSIERGVIRADYIERGDAIRKEYSLNKRNKKREQISNS